MNVSGWVQLISKWSRAVPTETVAVVDVASRLEENFRKACRKANIPAEWFGKSLTLRDREVQIVGLKKRTNAVVFKDVATNLCFRLPAAQFLAEVQTPSAPSRQD